MAKIFLIFLALLAACSGSEDSLSVSSVSHGTLTISWTAPTKNADGSPFTDIAGYRVLYGDSVEALKDLRGSQTSLSVWDVPATQTTLTIVELSPGIHYASVLALNSKGERSAVMGPVSGESK